MILQGLKIWISRFPQGWDEITSGFLARPDTSLDFVLTTFLGEVGMKRWQLPVRHLQCTYLPSNRLLEICQANRAVTGKAILNPVLTVDPRPKLKTADLQMFINSKPKRNENHLHSPWEALKIGTASRLWMNGDNIDEVARVVDYSDLETTFRLSF